MGLNSPITRLFVQQLLIQDNDKENIKIPHYCPFLRGIHRSSVDSPHKGLVMRKTLPRYDVIMVYPQDILEWFIGRLSAERVNWDPPIKKCCILVRPEAHLDLPMVIAWVSASYGDTRMRHDVKVTVNFGRTNVNPLYIELFWGNISIYFHYVSFWWYRLKLKTKILKELHR